MKLQFVKEGDSTFVISENAVYRGMKYEELLWCEILWSNPFFLVTWEDNYKAVDKFDTYQQAVDFIEQHHTKHSPYINGKSYKIEEE